MPRYRMLVEYDGTDFSGWQVQPGRRTVQQELERAFRTIMRHEVAVIGSGRTDAGVHARGQVAHFDLDAVIEPERLRHSLDNVCSPDVAVLALERAEDDFHARYSARERRYAYYVSTEPRALERQWRVPLHPLPDFAGMNRTAGVLLGTHDFNSFCRTQSDTENRICTVQSARWTSCPRHGDWHFSIAADRFLHGMVRTIVGTLLLLDRSGGGPESMSAILDARDRRAAGPAAKALGLVLEAVSYEMPVFTGPTTETPT